MAGILSTLDKELEAWENVVQDMELHDFLDQNKQVLQMLELSYKHLSQRLKPCFLYFATFREDEKISVKKLKQLWVAEGFIKEDEEKDIESISDEYLMKLIDKSLVMVLETGSDGKVKTCVMHDLLHSMCLRIAEEEKFLKRVDSYSSTEYLTFNRLLLLFPPTYEEFLQLCGSWFRSIFLGLECSYSPQRLPFVDKTSLRVLDDQSHQNGYVELDGIRHLVSLRYLAVGDHFPNSIGSFLKLEYLILSNTDVYIPSKILKMPKLRYLKARSLFVDHDCEISQLPNNLEYLSVLCISNLKFIELLKRLRRLSRLKLYFEGDFRPGFDLRFLTQLESLSVSCSGLPVGYKHQFEEGKYKFEEGIQFPSSVRKLSIDRLYYSWRSVSMIGALPNLEVLKLRDDACCGYTWNTSDSGFKKLRFLKLQGLNLRQWNISSSEHFPCLQQIVLHGLGSLEKIPIEIGEIQTLQVMKIFKCSKSVEESAKEIEQEQHDYGNEDFRVMIEKIWSFYVPV